MERIHNIILVKSAKPLPSDFHVGLYRVNKNHPRKWEWVRREVFQTARAQSEKIQNERQQGSLIIWMELLFIETYSDVVAETLN